MTQSHATQGRNYLRNAATRRKLGGISEATLFRLRKNDPDFPAPIMMGKTPMWIEDEIDQYMEKKPRRK